MHFIFQCLTLANLIHAEMEELVDLKEEKISLAIVPYFSLDQFVARVRNITSQLTYFSRSAYPGGSRSAAAHVRAFKILYHEG